MIIYKATNKVTGKCYIGQTVRTINYRKWGHQASAIKGSATYFHNSIRKYGIDNFSWEVICECDSKEELDEMERFFIKEMGDYNLTEGGDGVQLFGEANGMYGKKRPEQAGDLNPAKRPEVRKKISEANKGRKRIDLSKKNKQKAGKSYEEIYGTDKAEEIKQKMSDNRKGRKKKPFSQIACDNMSKSRCKYIFEMISPVGDIMTITSISRFAKEQGLNKASLLNLVHGRNKKGIHKGWKGKILKEINGL